MIWNMSVAKRVAARWLRIADRYVGPGQCSKCRGYKFGPGLVDCPECGGTGRSGKTVEEDSDVVFVWDSYPNGPNKHRMNRGPGNFKKSIVDAYRRFMKQIHGYEGEEPEDFLKEWGLDYREILVNSDDPDSAIGVVDDDDGRIQGHFYFPKSKRYEEAARELAEKDFDVHISKIS